MDDRIEHLVITGATGFVGRHFLRWVLRADTRLRVSLIVRGRDAAEAKSRIVRILARLSGEYGDPDLDVAAFSQRCTVLVGDVTQPYCGLTPECIRVLRNQGKVTFWHLAASLNFEESQQEHIENQNVTGTHAALDLACSLQCEHFVHVSTAYTCGQATGDIPEQAHALDGRFGNAYERSKCRAESVVAQRCLAAEIDYHILRPSIVVGISTSWAPAGSSTGLYGFARELARAKRGFAEHEGPVRVAGDGQGEVNLVPVDLVAERMVKLQMSGFPDSAFIHLTADSAPTVQQAVDAIADAVGIPHLHFVEELPRDASAFERILSRRLRFYSSYLKNPKRFRAQHGALPAVTATDVRRYADCYLDERSNAHGFIEHTIRARDGFSLRVVRYHRTTIRPRVTVVVVNALGMPWAALERLMETLAPSYDVVTWESRGAPNADGNLDEVSARFVRHVEDLEDVLANIGVRSAHILGWCTGSDVGLEFLIRHPSSVVSLVCLNSGFVGLCRTRTCFQENLERIVRGASKSVTTAQLYFQLMMGSGSNLAGSLTDDSDPKASVQMAMSCLDPDMAHLTGAPLRSPQMLQRYCQLLEHYFEEAPSRIPVLDTPTLFATSTDDEIAPFEATLQVAQAFTNGEVHFEPTGGHFAPCVDVNLAEVIAAFLARHPTRRCVVPRGRGSQTVGSRCGTTSTQERSIATLC